MSAEAQNQPTGSLLCYVTLEGPAPNVPLHPVQSPQTLTFEFSPTGAAGGAVVFTRARYNYLYSLHLHFFGPSHRNLQYRGQKSQMAAGSGFQCRHQRVKYARCEPDLAGRRRQ